MASRTPGSRRAGSRSSCRARCQRWLSARGRWSRCRTPDPRQTHGRWSGPSPATFGVGAIPGLTAPPGAPACWTREGAGQLQAKPPLWGWARMGSNCQPAAPRGWQEPGHQGGQCPAPGTLPRPAHGTHPEVTAPQVPPAQRGAVPGGSSGQRLAPLPGDGTSGSARAAHSWHRPKHPRETCSSLNPVPSLGGSQGVRVATPSARGCLLPRT